MITTINFKSLTRGQRLDKKNSQEKKQSSQLYSNLGSAADYMASINKAMVKSNSFGFKGYKLKQQKIAHGGLSRAVTGSKSQESLGYKDVIPKNCDQIECELLYIDGFPNEFKSIIATKAAILYNVKAHRLETKDVNLESSQINSIKCEHLNIKYDTKINGLIEVPSLSNISIIGSTPYLNPFLIKTSDGGDYNPNNLTTDNNSPYMPKTVYFDEPYCFIKNYKVKNVESKSSLTFKDQSKGNNITTKGNITVLDQAQINDITSENSSVIIKGRGKANNINANNINLFDNAQANEVNAHNNVYLHSNSKAKVVISESGNIHLLNDGSQVDKLISTNNIDLKGKGKIGSIIIKGNKVVITGPIKLGEKIKFDNNKGVVVIKKDQNGEYSKITSGQIVNGKLGFESENGKLLFKLGNDYDKKLNTLLAPPKAEPKYKAHLNSFADGAYSDIIGFASEYPVASEKIKKLASNSNLPKIERLYDRFTENTLQTLALGQSTSAQNPQFTAYWAANKKLGNKNLTDFWLDKLGRYSESMPLDQKLTIINGLGNANKKTLIAATAREYVQNVLPVELNRLNNNDLGELDESQNFNADTIRNLLQSGEYQNRKIDDKPIIDFWIDAVEGNGASDEYEESSIKRERVAELIEDEDSAKKIINETLKASGNTNSLIKAAKAAYGELIDKNPEFNDSQKELLREYENSKLFFYVVTDKINDPKFKLRIKGKTAKVTKELVNEKNAIREKANAEVFTPLRDYKTVFENIDDPEVSSKVDLVFDLLGNKIELSNQPEADKTKSELRQFKEGVEHNSYNTGSTWNRLVNEAKEFFNTETLSAVTTKNIKKLHSINTKLGANATILNDKTLDTIEQKEFIARYKGDKNFDTMLANSAVRKKEAIDSLLSFENFNKATFKLMSHVFRENLSPELVKENKDLADRYLTALGKEPACMTDQHKYGVLSSIPKEELELVSHKVSKDWKTSTLAKFMSNKFVDIELEHNVNYGHKEIKDALNRANNYLSKITVNTGRQNETLEHICQNFDSYVDLYKNTESIKIEQLQGINQNTLSIKANTRAILFNVSQGTKDPELRAKIKELLPKAEQESLQDFYQTLDRKAQEETDARKRQKLKNLRNLVIAGAVGVTAVAAGPAILTAAAATPLGTAVIGKVAATASVLGNIVNFQTVQHGLEMVKSGYSSYNKVKNMINGTNN